MRKAAAMPHSEAFQRVRDRIVALEDEGDRARLAGLLGSMTMPPRPLGPLRDLVREIAALEDADLERLVVWFTRWVNRWGQMPRASGMRIDPRPRP